MGQFQGHKVTVSPSEGRPLIDAWESGNNFLFAPLSSPQTLAVQQDVTFLSVSVSVFMPMAVFIDQCITIVYPLKLRMSKICVWVQEGDIAVDRHRHQDER